MRSVPLIGLVMAVAWLASADARAWPAPAVPANRLAPTAQLPDGAAAPAARPADSGVSSDALKVALWAVLSGSALSSGLLWLALRRRTAQLNAREALLAAESDKRRTAEDTAYRRLHTLTELIDLSTRLARGDGADRLCQRAVSEGRKTLGCDRLNVWLLDGDAAHVRGAFSADLKGQVHDERASRASVTEGSALGRVMTGLSKTETEDVADGAEGKQEGWRCVVPLENRSGEVIGALRASSARRDQRPEDFWGHLLRFYGVAVGHLLEAEWQTERLGQSEEKYRELVENANSIILRRDVDGRITFFNEYAQQFFGYGEDELLQRNMVGTIVPPTDSTGRDLASMVQDIGRHPERYATGEIENVRRNGERVWVSWTNRAIRDAQGRVREVLCVGNDVTARRRAESQVESLLRLHQNTLATIPSSLLVLDGDLNVIMANRSFLRQRGTEPGAVVGSNMADVLPAALLGEQRLLERIGRVAGTGGQDELLGLEWKDGEGTSKYVDVRICGTQPAGGRHEDTRVLVVLDDVTERRMMETHMHQVAKMESIGRLAGGVAHDFNNLLTVINGYAELIARSDDADAKLRRHAEEIIAVSSRAADLTRQLQAFGRRQALQPRLLSLNEVLRGMERMLCRIIGEDIELATSLGDEVGTIRADPAQVEQVLVNLAANSRDAMAYGGKLTIETSNVELDWKYAHRHPGARPGRFVMMSVSDTGCGMDQETQDHIFEPFFTTKEVGKGTGLGLSTVYGIVKQHGGNIWVYSESGRGTTFKVYLPQVEGRAERLRERVITTPVPRGTETVLLAEDEGALRALTEKMLEDVGYSVLTASCADEAQRQFALHAGEINLLLTDVIMPGRSGRELYESLKAEHPWLKVLYISGYADSAIVHHGVLEEGTPFLQKPFQADVLARKVREVLDSGAPVADASAPVADASAPGRVGQRVERG